ncbi:cell division protein FtsA [Limosilactobacillus fermentum]
MGSPFLPGIKEIASEYYDGNVKVYVPDEMGVRHPSFALAIARASTKMTCVTSTNS